MQTPYPAYSIVTPVCNEEANIAKTLESVVNQTIPPQEWIIVNDGSTDRTAEIVDSYVSHHSWIRLHNLPPKQEHIRGGHIVRVFEQGVAQLTKPFDFLVKLDGDLAFEPDYFAQLLEKFEQDPRLGIAGGECYEWNGQKWQIEKTASDHVRGATKMYRRSCLNDIGGLDAVNGWDNIDEWRAQMLSWRTQGFPELIVQHYRPTGAMEKGRFGGKMKLGEFAYFLGYPWLVIIARSFYRAFTDRPFLLAGLAIFWGYARSWWKREPRFDDPRVLAYARKRHLRRLLPEKFPFQL